MQSADVFCTKRPLVHRFVPFDLPAGIGSYRWIVPGLSENLAADKRRGVGSCHTRLGDRVGFQVHAVVAAGWSHGRLCTLWPLGGRNRNLWDFVSPPFWSVGRRTLFLCYLCYMILFQWGSHPKYDHIAKQVAVAKFGLFCDKFYNKKEAGGSAVKCTSPGRLWFRQSENRRAVKLPARLFLTNYVLKHNNNVSC